MSNQEIIKFDVSLSLPDFSDDVPASDKQRAAIRVVLTDAFNDTEFTREQASLILDMSSYLNGVFSHIVSMSRDELSDNGLFILKISCICKISHDETLWRRIRAWGRTRYSLGRSENVPKLNTKSQLFSDTLSLVISCAKDTSIKILKEDDNAPVERNL